MPTMTGSRCLAEMLQRYGLTHIFGVPAVFYGAINELDKLGVTTVMAHSELAAAYMADGYARARLGPGVCFAQSVGAANLAAGLRDAYLAHSPLVAFTGGPSVAHRHRGLYQEIEDLPMFDAVTKFSARVEDVSRLPDLVRHCFRTAMSGAPQPCHLQIRERLGSGLDHVADLEPTIQSQFATQPPYRPEPDAASVAQAAELLAKAERPVILAGGGLIASGGGDALVALAEAWQIPVATSLNAKHLLPDDHPLMLGITGTYGRWASNEALMQADLICYVGSSAGGHVTDNWRVPDPSTPTIQIDLDPTIMGRNHNLVCGIVADAKVTLERILATDATCVDRTAWVASIAKLQRAWWETIAPLAASDQQPMRPERLLADVSAALPDDGVAVADTGNSAIWAGTMLCLRDRRQRFIRCAGTLGWSVPAAIGAQCALPNRQVVCLTGDGGLYYHMGELETAARLGIPAVFVVINNGSWLQTRPGWDKTYGDEIEDAEKLWVFQKTDFASVARAMGCHGLRVTDPGDLRDAMAWAMERGGPVLLDVVCADDAEPPLPWR